MPFNKQKKLGQVFLNNNNVIQKIIEATEIKFNDKILEIGPGKGILTEAIVKTEANVITVEKDAELVKFLKNKFKNKSNLKIINADIRDFIQSDDWQAKYGILNTRYKAIGNIPYYLTSYLIQLLLESKNQPQDIILMIQKEVAQRIISQQPKMNLLAASVQFYAKPKIICYVSKDNFFPKPKVDSAIIKLTPCSSVTRDETTRQSFFKIVKVGFKQPRKLLINNLSNNLKIEKEAIKNTFKKLNIPLTTRAQNLSIKQWISLSLLLTKNIV